MRKIIVPTDFSENAAKALNYAIVVANATGAALHVIHTIHTRGSAGHFLSIDDIIMKERETELAAVVKNITPQLNEKVVLTHSVRQGYVVDAILASAENVGADTIIMGTQGASGLKRWVLGSTTVDLLKNTKLTVLVVPNEFKSTEINRLALAVDASRLKDVAVLQPMLLLAQKFKMELNLLHISKDEKTITDIDSLLHQHLQELGMQYVAHRITSTDVEQAIKDFVANHKINLLCVLNQSEKRSWVENLFHLSITKEMAYETEVPLLVLTLPAEVEA
jgi:nucleotide-binding universal stress UspA family protein